jgi:SAM-dependent methyltransferase
MRTIDAGSLTRNNLAYREPALYDELLADHSLTDAVHALLDDGRDPPPSVLDLGCGTGRLLSQLASHGITGIGVDLQPDLVAWAQERHPTLQLEVADLRTVRLDTTFDVIVSVGNTLAYLHTEPELAAAFTTVAAHAHPGTILALSTLTGTGTSTRSSSEITTSLGPATVDTASEWNPTDSILTTSRTWRFANGRIENDTIRRRFWPLDTLDRHARDVGFRATPASAAELTLCTVMI